MAKMGRPLKFNNCMDMDAECELYFESCLYEDSDDGKYVLRETPIPFTITGLAMALGSSRDILMDYQNRTDFSNTIKRHKLRVENFAETRLYTTAPTGPIFALKNFGWTDKQEIDHQSSDGSMSPKAPELSDEQLLRIASGNKS